MGVDPIIAPVVLVVVAVGAFVGLIAEQSLENERRRKCEEENRKEARRRNKEREREEREERKKEEREKREREEEEEREWKRQLKMRKKSCDCPRCSLKNRMPALEFDFPFTSNGRNSCDCPRCTLKNRVQALEFDFPFTSNGRNSCNCPRCTFNKMLYSDTEQKNSVTVTFEHMQIREDKNQKAKNQASNTRASSSNNQTSNSSRNVSTKGTNSISNASSSGSQQPQRNNNDNNNKNEKYIIKDYGKLNDFIKKLKAALDRCNASAELRKKILAFFDDFKKHENNFLRILKDIADTDIAIEDILPIVIRLFQSDHFARDVTYGNFLALIEIVVTYITDELAIEIAKGHTDCLEKVLQRKNIVTEISDLFKKVEKEIIEDNKNRPLEPDFSGIYTKVYHYLKHRVVCGKEWPVTKYFYWIRKLLDLIKNLDPEYAELENVNNERREIVFEMYSTDYGGRFFMVVRAYGPIIRICTFYVKENRGKKDKSKDGDIYVDGKKRS